MFNLTVKEASAFGVPDFGDAKFEIAEMESFVENLIFTMNDFSNFFHTDKDSTI
jgi:hypothetical protein